MFESAKTKTYLQNVSFDGKDTKKIVRTIFYITPVSYDLAAEISQEMADTLFKDGNPRQVMPNVQFKLDNMALQSVTWHPFDDPAMDNMGALTHNCKISSISAMRPYPDKPDFRLIFRADFPMDSNIVALVHRYFRTVVFLTTSDMQGELFAGTEDPIIIVGDKCELCPDKPIYQDSKKSFFCAKHVRAGEGEVKLLVKQETPAEVARRIARETETKLPEVETKPPNGETEAPNPETKATAAEMGSLINKRNRESKRGSKAVH